MISIHCQLTPSSVTKSQNRDTRKEHELLKGLTTDWAKQENTQGRPKAQGTHHITYGRDVLEICATKVEHQL